MLDLAMRRAPRWLQSATCPLGAIVGLSDGAARTGVGRRCVLLGLAIVGAGVAALAATRLTATPTAPSSPAVPRIEIRRAADLPVADLGWVRMRDHFEVTVGPAAGRGGTLGDLLVLADATLAPHGAFPLHRHAGVEVVSLVLDGALSHEEPGRTVELAAGSAQAIAAGAGIVHAEANRGERPARMIQLWLASSNPEAAPAEQTLAPSATAGLALLPFAVVRPDVQLRAGWLAPGRSEVATIARGRVAYLLCAGGQVALDDAQLADGDGATLAPGTFTLTAADGPARVVLVDLPAPPAR